MWILDLTPVILSFPSRVEGPGRCVTKLSSKEPLHYSIFVLFCFSEEFTFFITLTKESDSDPSAKTCFRE